MTQPDSTTLDSSPDQFRYDAFISYSSKDSAWVRNVLLPRLENEGLRICIDFRDFDVGVPSLVNMENAVAGSRKTLLILTPNWVASEWTTFEALLVQTKDPIGRGRRILPLLVQQCSLPARLQIFTYLDLSILSEFDFQMKRLVAAIRSTTSQRPTAEPMSINSPAPYGSSSSGGINYSRGLSALKQLLTMADVDTQLNFSVLESRLLENIQGEQLYGGSENIRADRAHIIRELNRIALQFVKRSFNDMCQE